jgi:uncharacterized membrane protein YciS (DUF1049 family)
MQDKGSALLMTRVDHSTNGSNTPVNETTFVNEDHSPQLSDDEKYYNTVKPQETDGNVSEEDFNWEEEVPEEKTKINDRESRGCFCCLDRNSSRLSWSIYILLTLISIAVCVIIFVTVKPQRDPTLASYNLALWFTFIAFLFAVSFVTQMIIELLPWLIKKLSIVFFPDKTEVLRSRLSVSD